MFSVILFQSLETKFGKKKIPSGLTAGSLNVPWPTSKHEFIAQQQCVRIVCGFIHGYIT